jgi:hypothetical protein
MVHATALHPNAPLAVEGRRRMVGCVLERGWSVLGPPGGSRTRSNP